MKKVILSIGGMSCSACSTGLEKYLNKQPGIVKASVNLVLGNVLIEYDDEITMDDLTRYIKDAGFVNQGIYDEKMIKGNNKGNKMLILFGILSLLVLYISMAHMVNLPNIWFLDMDKYPVNYAISLLVLSIPYLIYGFDIFKNGYKNLVHKTANMDTLVTIGIISSFLYSLYGTIMVLCGNYENVHCLYYESLCMVLFFVKLGRFIESSSKEKTKDAIRDLVQITPEKAIVMTDDGKKEVTLDEIKKGDMVVCQAGMKVAVDGVIKKGEAYFDEAFITGESLPVKKGVGDSVVAGSLNMDGSILYEALKIGKDSTISEIVRLVSLALNTKAPISRIADKVSGIFVPGIMIISLITLVGYLLCGGQINTAFVHSVSVLVVACPCALGLATPLSMLISEGMCAKRGVLVKKSEILENANKIDTVVFDKTGTLTYGKLSISKIYNYSNCSEKELMKIMASLEDNSTHPIASAFKIEGKLYNVADFKNIDGKGLMGVIKKNKYYMGSQKIVLELGIENDYVGDEEWLVDNGNSIVYLVQDNKIIALVGVKDLVRDNAKKVVSLLKEMDRRVVMLTGDNEKTAKLIGDSLGIDQVIAGVMPKDKTYQIKKLMDSGRNVMMVGDGINDAPSLASANIGVAISSGTDIANNSASVILMSNNLMGIIYLMKISKKTIRNIKQNLFWAFFYNICMIPIATGIFTKWGININPMIAGFAMTISSLTVVFNALRLRKIKFEEE